MLDIKSLLHGLVRKQKSVSSVRKLTSSYALANGICRDQTIAQSQIRSGADSHAGRASEVLLQRCGQSLAFRAAEKVAIEPEVHALGIGTGGPTRNPLPP